MNPVKQILLNIINGIERPTFARVPEHRHRCVVQQNFRAVGIFYLGNHKPFFKSLLDASRIGGVEFKTQKLAYQATMILYMLLREQGYDVAIACMRRRKYLYVLSRGD